MFTGYIEYNKGAKVLTLKTPKNRKGDVNFMRLLQNAITKDKIETVELLGVGGMMELKLHTIKALPQVIEMPAQVIEISYAA